MRRNIQKIYKHEDGSGEDYYYDVNTKDYVEYTQDIDEKQNKLYKLIKNQSYVPSYYRIASKS